MRRRSKERQRAPWRLSVRRPWARKARRPRSARRRPKSSPRRSLTRWRQRTAWTRYAQSADTGDLVSVLRRERGTGSDLPKYVETRLVFQIASRARTGGSEVKDPGVARVLLQNALDLEDGGLADRTLGTLHDVDPQTAREAARRLADRLLSGESRLSRHQRVLHSMALLADLRRRVEMRSEEDLALARDIAARRFGWNPAEGVGSQGVSPPPDSGDSDILRWAGSLLDDATKARIRAGGARKGS